VACLDLVVENDYDDLRFLVQFDVDVDQDVDVDELILIQIKLKNQEIILI
jgi:hypothetical protein